ncbi:MAG: metallophosphoesterase, partial [bacterium]|nr:metallophosphoesterase [bacterium]
MIYLLHISDLHLVTDPQWNNMKNAILYSVREKLSPISCGQKLLVITGDFHNFVQKDYIQAQSYLPQLFDAMGIEPDKDVFVVPGNHDISISDLHKNDRDIAIQAAKKNPNFLQRVMDKLLPCYEDYIELVKKLKCYPLDCGNSPVCVHVRSWRGKLNLLHLNTTLIADGTRDCQMVDTVAATSDDIRMQLNAANLPCIAIGHNSFFDLLSEHQIQLSAMFAQEYISAYLCGDKHKRNSVRENKWIEFDDKISGGSIPNIVSYKSSTDVNDTYSDFGMIWHIWDEETGQVDLEYMKWDSQNQAKLQPDGNDHYYFRKLCKTSSFVPTPTIIKENGCWLLNDYILARSKIDVKDIHIHNFLYGGCCQWNIAFSNRIVLRDIVDELYKDAIKGGIYALVGPGGEGKSTILMQLCAKLVLEEIPVYYYRGYGTLMLPYTISDKAVFVIDNPHDSMQFRRFLDSVIENGQTLILGARQNEWNLLKMSLTVPDRTVLEIPLQKLTIKEAGHFAECIDHNLKCLKSKKEIEELFQNNSYGFLYAAMLIVVNNKGTLEEIAQKIINRLKEGSYKALLLLAHIVLSERSEIKFLYKEFKVICNQLNISPRDASRALSREISLNGDIYQTRHNVISNLFYKELFSDSGCLSVNDIDSILENLTLFYLDRYKNSYGSIKYAARNSIMQLLDGLSQASFKTQIHLINRILDEVKQEPLKIFAQVDSYINDEEVKLLFYQQCFDRGYILSAFLLKWCDLLRKNGSSWTIDEPYSPAWIMRSACIEQNADSNAWLAWARMEVQENQLGDYEKENTARWIFREAC